MTNESWRITTPIDEHTCPFCKQMHERQLPPETRLDELPPFKQCENPDGCRCMAERNKIKVEGL